MKYDYIFAGVGLAAVMVLLEMKRSDLFSGKRILLIEPGEKKTNDRTWCFWENGAGAWDWAVKKEWSSGGFKNKEYLIPCVSQSRYLERDYIVFFGFLFSVDCQSVVLPR